MSKYDFEVQHIPGKENIVADILSRTPELFSDKDDQEDMAKDEAIFDSITPKGPDIGADRDVAQCNLVCVCIDEHKQCNFVTGGGGDVDPEVITVSNTSTHRDVVDQANLGDAPDFASFDPGPGLKDILRDDKISHLIWYMNFDFKGLINSQEISTD